MIVARVDRRLDLARHLAGRDHDLLGKVAAALRVGLVLDLDGVGARALEGAHGALRIERIAEAGIRIDDEPRRDAIADEGDGLGNLGGRHEADVRPAEPRIGDGRPRNVQGLEAGGIGNECREGIIDAWRQNNARLMQPIA